MPVELDILRGIRTLAAAVGTSAILLFIFTIIINIITMFPKRVNPDKRKTRPWELTAAVRIDELPEAGQEIVNQGRPKRVKRYESNEGFVLDYNRNRQSAQKYRGKGKAFTGDGEIGRRQLEPLSRLRPTPLSLWTDKRKPPQHPPLGGPSGGPSGPPGPPGPGGGGGGRGTATGRPEPSGTPGPGPGRGAGGGIGITSAPPRSGTGGAIGIISAPPVTSGITSSVSTRPDSSGLPHSLIPPNIDFWIPWEAGNTDWAMALARERQGDVSISADELLKSFEVLNLPVFYDDFYRQFVRDPAYKDCLSGDTGHPYWFFQNMKNRYYGDRILPYVKPSQEEFDRARIERTTKEGREAIIQRARQSMKYAQLFGQGVKPSPSNTSSPAPLSGTTSVPAAPLPNISKLTSGIGIKTTGAITFESILAALRASPNPASKPPPVGSTSGNTATGNFPIQDEQVVADYIKNLRTGLITGSSSQVDTKTTTAPVAINPFATAPRPPQTSRPTVSTPAAPATPGGGLFGGLTDKIGGLIHGLITPSSDAAAAAEVRKAFGPPNDLIVLPPTVKQNVPFHYVSDLHLEQTSYLNFDFKPRAPYLILAGDIGNTGKQSETQYREFLVRMCAKAELKRVFLVAGNRDFWPSNSNTVEGTIEMLRGFARHPDTLGKLVFMENDRFVIEENGGKVVILGCTLWTERRRSGGREPRDQNNQQRTARHHASCEWIRKETKKIREDPYEVETRILIITHMPPSKSGTSPPEQTAKKLRDFSSGDGHGSDVIDGCKGHGYDHSSIQTTMPLLDWRDVWIWGHTHWNEPRYGKTRHGGMRFESNQRGNASGNPVNYHPKPPGAFKPEKIILV
ncbi:putative ser thr protein phosphatase protein [Botrytis fragariae]|uniref:Putative ser thr protein phosphatase protein n=1 Tax=Botrytis fragariae TaxID=1964551 RepID=A0A8H6AFU3_9HELO|nr:putative ser thr protein phosphatase protein [Botrytis fragariae]KAF5867521.1 putative ser thr protein phosphatase protein [Botrytis fragariae]